MKLKCTHPACGYETDVAECHIHGQEPYMYLQCVRCGSNRWSEVAEPEPEPEPAKKTKKGSKE